MLALNEFALGGLDLPEAAHELFHAPALFTRVCVWRNASAGAPGSGEQRSEGATR
jgi:hypothetical protein